MLSYIRQILGFYAASMLKSNVDRLLKVRAEIDEELRRHKIPLTILFTDVVGSTSYFDKYGDTSGLAMLQRHANLSSKAVGEFGGRVIKTMGDSVMAEFPEPAAGVRASVEIQRRLVDLNQTLADPERLQLRIGINYGLSFRHGNDLYGDAVNLAARITKCCGPAQILISRSVRESIAQDGKLVCASLGKMLITGRAEKEDVFEVIWTDPATYRDLRQSVMGALESGVLLSPGLKIEELAQPHVPSAIELKNADNGSPLASAAITGRYDILGELGRGGMGIVYKALDRETGELIALKVLKPDITDDEAINEGFKNELRLARKITHRNVCRIHEFHRSEGTAYISMEYIDGQSLRNLLKRPEGVTLNDGLKIATQICAGLKEAHKGGIVHRDLKPENIMIDGKGNVKIMDFGIARSVEISEANPRSGPVVGTPAYMSPEQAQGLHADHRTDIYAVGLILYEMFTKQRPFQADTPISVALQQTREVPRPPRELEPSIPPKVETIILKCLEKEPDQRYQSVDESEAALNKQLNVATFLAHLAGQPSSRTPGQFHTGRESVEKEVPPIRPVRQEFQVRWPFAAAGLVVLLFTIIFTIHSVRSKNRLAVKSSAALPQPQPVVTPANANPANMNPPANLNSNDQNGPAELEITKRPAGSEVIVDGKRQSDKGASKILLAPGDHKITLRPPSSQPDEANSIARENPTPPIKLAAPIVIPPPPSIVEPFPKKAETPSSGGVENWGRVVVRTKPEGARIFVDGKSTSYRSPVNFSIHSGRHQIKVEQPGFESETRELEVVKDKTVQFKTDLKSTNPKQQGLHFPFFH